MVGEGPPFFLFQFQHVGQKWVGANFELTHALEIEAFGHVIVSSVGRRVILSDPSDDVLQELSWIGVTSSSTEFHNHQWLKIVCCFVQLEISRFC